MLILLECAFYLPLFYQRADEHTATRSGLDILSFMICVVVGAGLAGGIINVTGRPRPFLVGSPLLASLGSGLVFWDLTHSGKSSNLLGFQVLLGIGVGGAFQNAIIAIQAEYAHEPKMVPQSTSLVNFTQLTGGIIGIAIAGTIFGNQLSKSLAIHAPNLSPALALAVRQSVQVIRTLDPEDKVNVVKAYTQALGYVFLLGIPSGILASASGLLIRNFNLKAMKFKPGVGATA